jgi:predicted TIM-barrel fold metal-dependent hydrolase
MAQPVIVDTHVHLHRTSEQVLHERSTYNLWEYGTKEDVRYSTSYGDLESVLKALNTADASWGVVLNLFDATYEKLDPDLNDNALGDRLRESNAWFCNVVKGHTHLIPFIGIDLGIMNVDEAQNHIQEMVTQYGAKGIKLHPVLQKFYLHNPQMVYICKICLELDIPILAHCGPSKKGEQYGEPKAYAKILEEMPELRLILAHLGGGAWQQTSEFAHAYSNAYFDCSEIIHWTGATNAPSDHELAQLILDVGPERVMMGSDFPWYDIDHTAERVMDLPLLSKEQKESILGENAIRILRL